MTDASRNLWLLLSPSLPVGGYSYSQGLEQAVHDCLVCDFESARAWILGLARQMLPRLDLPVLLRLCRALRNGEREEFTRWNQTLLAMRETAELRHEDLAMGSALRRLLITLSDERGETISIDSHNQHTATRPASWHTWLPSNLTFAAALAVTGQQWCIDNDTLSDACAWIWAENQIAAAVKLVPLGHSDGQRLLLEIAGQLPSLTAAARACTDQQLGYTATGLALCSAGHETMPARQFRT